jgi:TolB-like protein/class 3 adenylate cyclase
MSTTHTLAAIMFTDIVGYTTLMERDEDLAFAILGKNRAIQQPLIEKYNGSWIKEIGDGVLASFKTISEAVYCAKEIMTAISAEPDLNLRIAIHEGEVIKSEGDLFGSGVNIASRIEAMAPANSIWITEPVYRNISNKIDFQVVLVGEKSLRHVKEPIKIYEVLTPISANKARGKPFKMIINKRLTSPKNILLFLALITVMVAFYLLVRPLVSVHSSNTTETVLSSQKSIAVLPLKYLSADAEKEYLSNGVVEAIIGHLSKLEGLRVTPRTSTEQYRQSSKTAKLIGQELGVGYLIEGSFLMVENQVRLTVNLINTKADEQLFHQEYHREWNDIFEVQSELAQLIAKEVKITVTPQVQARIEEKPTESLEAYNLYLQARHFWTLEGMANFDKSIEYYEMALTLDPDFALAYVGKAITYNSYGWYGYLPNKEILPYAKEAAIKALEKNNLLGEAHTELAFTKMLLDWDWQGAEESFFRALQLSPNYDRAHNMYAWHLSLTGNHVQAIQHQKLAHDVDPMSVVNWVNLGRSYYFAREYDNAIKEFQAALEIYPNSTYSPLSWYPRAYLGLAFTQKSMYKEAIEEYLKADYELSWYCYLGYTYGLMGNEEKAMEVLEFYEKLAKEEYVWNASLAIVHIGLGHKEEALNLLEKAINQKEGWVTFFKVDPIFDSLRDEPRYRGMMKNLNFPK